MDYPTLRGLSGADQRALMFWLSHFLGCVAWPDPRLPLLQLVYRAAVSFENICDGAGRFFSAAELAGVQEAGDAFGVAYNALALDAVLKGVRLFKIVPKHHMFCSHMILDQCPLANPRRTQNYQDEYVTGVIKKSGCRVQARQYSMSSYRPVCHLDERPMVFDIFEASTGYIGYQRASFLSEPRAATHRSPGREPIGTQGGNP